MDLLNEASRCLRQDIPLCSGACPFHLDIRVFTDYLKKGKWNRAYDEYRKSVLLPFIVSEICSASCEKVCFRSEIDDPVQIRSLEQAAVSLSSRRKKGEYRTLSKEQKVLIVGAGLSGIAAASKLADRGYEVKLADDRETPGGSLWERYPEIDREEALRELEQVLDNKNISTSYETVVSESDMAGYDAVIIAAGRNNTLSADMEGVFCTGEAEDDTRSNIEALASAFDTVQIVDAFLRKVSPVLPEIPESRYRPDTGKWEKKEAVLNKGKCLARPDDARGANGYSEEDVISEAGRCQKCTCNECIDSCSILRAYYSDPLKALNDINGALHKTEMSTKKAQPFINNCTLCGKCGSACPQEIDLGKACLYARQQLQARNDLPPVYHEYWINESLYSSGNKASLVRTQTGGSAEWVFFPGCQLGSSDPEYVVRTYNMLLERLGDRGGMFLRCCGIPLHWAGKEDLFREQLDEMQREYESLGSPLGILTCPSCQKVFAEYLPQVRTQMLWSIPDIGREATVAAEHTKDSYALFDPCVSAGSPELRNDVRAFLKASGIRADEPDPQDETGGCCGYGGLIYLTNRNIYREAVSDAANLSQKDYVTYCINCRDSFVSQGKRANHILDLLLFDEDRSERKPPTPTERRRNRTELRDELLKKFWGEDAEKRGDQSRGERIVIDGPARDRISDMLLLEDDVIGIVDASMHSNEMIRLSDNAYTCYGAIGVQTCHADFTYDEEGICHITDVYTHRVRYLGAEGAAFADVREDLRCCRCDQALRDADVSFEYLGHRLKHSIPVCPLCGQMYLPRELCETRIYNVELTLEEK